MTMDKIGSKFGAVECHGERSDVGTLPLEFVQYGNGVDATTTSGKEEIDDRWSPPEITFGHHLVRGRFQIKWWHRVTWSQSARLTGLNHACPKGQLGDAGLVPAKGEGVVVGKRRYELFFRN